LKDKKHLFDDVNIQIVDENENPEKQITFPNGFYLHCKKRKILRADLEKDIYFGDWLSMILRFDGYCLERTPGQMSFIIEQDFPLLKTFSMKRRLIVYNEMMSNKRKRDYVEEVPDSFHLLCNKIQASILQWYIDKNVTTLFH
jgi:hypothetical protein